ncbi:hypothetical protein AKJ09_11414 [Labilithrix luteola]|uniref:Peptidase S1 domain-containing protein n=2 Tax=Labilithrix luteola TaxID=1391654 RepID=A0A0K1QG63_9BACT|nr:hypothetical protein AKJ09_11414 [Labilithrix luteola]
MLGVVAASCSSSESHDPSGGTEGPTGKSRSPIINGDPDTTHSAVVAIIASSSSATTLCSGTIVKVDAANHIGWVLTAAHCVATPPTIVLAGSDFSKVDVTRYLPIDFTFDSRYQQGGDAGQRFDFAMIRIGGVDATTPTIPVTTANDGLTVGQNVLALGFGRTRLIDAGTDTNTLRRSATLTISALDTNLIAYDLRERGICEGDSGGPDLVTVNGVDTVVGVHSFIVNDCDGQGVSGRVSGDLEFIDAALAEPLPTRDCDLCTKIVNSGNQECALITTACLTNPDCAGFYTCPNATTSPGAAQACLQKFPQAQGPVIAASQCPCNRSCADVCASTPACQGVPKCGFAVQGACGTCTEGGCCQQLLDCSADANCYQCLVKGNGDSSCASSQLHQQLTACINSQCQQQCATAAQNNWAQGSGATALGGTTSYQGGTSNCSAAGGRRVDDYAAWLGGLVALATALVRRRASKLERSTRGE